jgi:trimethylamine-N-oxide reductase (cytochrome c)
MGKADGVAKTPEWAAPKCGVKPRDIRALAREWAKGPVFVMCNNGGANRGWNGDDWARMIITLQTMQGNIGKPGGNLNGVWSEPTLSLKRPATGRTGISFILPADPWPIHSHPQYTVWADCIVNGSDKPTKWVGGTTGSVKYWKEFSMEHVYPYPGVSEIKMLAQQAPGGFNIEAGWFEDKARAYMSPKVECAWTATINQREPTARYSDIILPICTNFERVDITSIVNKWFVYMAKCIEPLGESVSDMELFLRLATRLGFGDKMYNGMSEEDMAKGLFQWSHGPKFTTWEDFKKQGGVIVPFDPKLAGADTYVPKPAMNWYYTKPKGDGLTTPTGMIEIYHQPFADFYGENGPISAIPKWREPSSLNLKEGKDGPLASKYPLVAHIAHFKWRFHSEFGHVSWLRELYKIKGPDGYEYEPIWINPVDAQARGINHGDIVKVSSNWGEMLCAAFLTQRTMPGAPKITYGAWVDPVDPRSHSLDKGGNAESILTSQMYKNHSCQVCAEHVMVQIEKWKG